MTYQDGEHRIVVGVDGSASSRAALAWAVKQARLTGAAIEAVIAWDYPATYGYPITVASEVSYEDLAAKVLAEAVGEIGPLSEGIKISSKVTEGYPAEVLLDASVTDVVFRQHGIALRSQPSLAPRS